MIDPSAATHSSVPRLLPVRYPLLALAGLLIALLLYRQTFREATISLNVDSANAEQRALAFLANQGVTTNNRWRSTSFQTDTTAQDYLIAATGLAELEQLAGRDLNFARWHVRLFTPLDPEEWSVDVSSRTGRILSYQHTVKEEAPGMSLASTAAEQLALQALRARPGGGPIPSELHLLVHRETRQPHRIDQTFTWEQPALQRGDASYRYSVTVYGDQIGGFDEFYNIPASWNRLASWHSRRGGLINLIGWTASYALMAGLGIAWLWAAGRRLLRPRFALTLLAAIGVLGIATALNSVPLMFVTLPTNISLPAYVANQIGAYAGLALLLSATIIIAGMAGEALARATAQRRAPATQMAYALSNALTRRGLVSVPVVRSLLIGICVGVAQLGYITLFYWVGQRWFGVWAPIDPNYDDILSTPLPWLYAMALGLLPAIGEELVFRLGGIALLQRLTGMPRLAVVITALVWASLHTTYAQQPFFIRLIELTVVGIIFGVLFLRYGILTSMAAHYTYNAALMVPLLVQGSWVTQLGILFAVGGAAWLLLPALLQHMRGLPLAALPSVERTPTTQASTEPTDNINQPANAEMGQLARHWPIMLAVCSLIVWSLANWRLPQPPLLHRPLTRNEAILQGQVSAQRLQLDTNGLYAAAVADATLMNLDSNYLREQPGEHSASATINTYGLRSAWRVTFSAWDRDDSVTLWLDTSGQLLAFDRSLPEDAFGAMITPIQAQKQAETLLRQQHFDLDHATLVESSTITRSNRVDHRFVWECQPVIGAAAHERILVVLQGDQSGTLAPFLYTPPEYRRDQDRSTLARMLTHDVVPLLPAALGLLISSAGLLLAIRRPAPLRLMVVVGGFATGCAWLNGILNLNDAQLAQPARLVQGIVYALYTGIFSGAELALLAGGTLLLWQIAYPRQASLEQKLHALWRHAHTPATRVYWRNICLIGFALLTLLLAFTALQTGLADDPGAVRSPNSVGALLPSLALLLEQSPAALHTVLLLVGAVALLSCWHPLRPFALALVMLGAVLVASQPDRLLLWLFAIAAWIIASLLARGLRGHSLALLLALWWFACLPDALELIALGRHWYAINGILVCVVLLAPVLLFWIVPTNSASKNA